MRQRARLLFDIASEQESCLFRLFDPGVFAGKHRFYRDRCLPVSDALRSLSDINLRAIDTVFEIINDLLRLRYGSFLSPFTLSEGKNDFCCRLIDRLSCPF